MIALRSLDIRKREGLVREILADNGIPMTDRQIAYAMALRLGLPPDPNLARPRITGMIQAGVLREDENVRDPTTQKRVRTVVLVEEAA
jgi:hypothetical protein